MILLFLTQLFSEFSSRDSDPHAISPLSLAFGRENSTILPHEPPTRHGENNRDEGNLRVDPAEKVPRDCCQDDQSDSFVVHELRVMVVKFA